MAVSQETLAALRSVRTSDVCDVLDSMGLQQRYEMDPEMRPLYVLPIFFVQSVRGLYNDSECNIGYRRVA